MFRNFRMFLVQVMVTKKTQKMGIQAPPRVGNFPKFYQFFSAPLSEFFATGGVPPTPPLSPQLIVGQKDFRNGGWDTPKIHNFFGQKTSAKGDGYHFAGKC